MPDPLVATPAAAPAVVPAPTPAPAAAPAAAPSPAAAPPGGSAPPDSAGDPHPFAELEQKFADYDKKADAAKGKPSTPPPATPAAKPDAAPKAAAAPAAKPEATKRPAELMRAEIDKWKGEAEAKAALLAANEAKIKEFEARNKDTEALVARSTQLEKEVEEARSELRAIRQEATPEFIEKYKAPFDAATDYATHVIKNLVVTDEESGAQRPGTFADLNELFLMPINKASAKARQMFGDDAPTVINHVNELQRLNYTYTKALNEERANAAERAKAEQGRLKTAEAQIQSSYLQINKDLAESVEDYRDKPDDAESAALRQRGYSIFDAPPANREQAVIKKAHVRQIVAAHYPLKLQNTRLKSELDAAKAELAALKEPDPGGKTRRPGGAPAAGSDGKTWEQEARETLT